jgi:uncharacterized protein
MKKISYVFTSPSQGEVGLEKMVNIISSFISEQPGAFYRVVIGSDSQAKRSNGDSEVDFVTAVVVHRIGRGAKYFWRKEKQKGTIILRDKIYTETLMSLKLAEDLVPLLRKNITPAKYDLEIHIDVGPLGPTREMIREVVGMVTGSGYVAKTKPDSWGASKVADKHT